MQYGIVIFLVKISNHKKHVMTKITQNEFYWRVSLPMTMTSGVYIKFTFNNNRASICQQHILSDRNHVSYKFVSDEIHFPMVSPDCL